MPEKIYFEQNYTPTEEELLVHQKTETWAKSLIERHNEAEHLSLLKYDPIKYPFQRLDSPLIESAKPSPIDLLNEGINQVNRDIGSYKMTPPIDELMVIGAQRIQENRLAVIRHVGKHTVGVETYNKLVGDLIHLGGSEKFPENGLRTLWARMHTRNNHSAILTRHNNLMDTPLVQKALVDAFSRSEFLKEDHYIQNFGEFDISKFAEQNFQTVGFALTRIAVNGQPVIPYLSETCNVLVVMPIKGSRDMGIDRRTIINYNRAAKEMRKAKLDDLRARGLSIIDHIAPAGTTTKKLRDDHGNVVALRSDPVDSMLAESLAKEESYMVPVTLYLNGDESAERVHVGEPHAVYRGEQVIELTSQMAKDTERMSGKPFYESPAAAALGGLAIAS